MAKITIVSDINIFFNFYRNIQLIHLRILLFNRIYEIKREIFFFYNNKLSYIYNSKIKI